MSKYIDRDKLLKDVSRIGRSPWSEWETAGVFNVIRKQPIVDAVPVIRCRECGHYDLEAERCKFWPDEGYRAQDHYCGEGERRTDHAAQEEKSHAGTDRGQT